MRMMAVSWALVFLVLLAGLVVAAILGIVAMARRGPSPVARLASVPVRAPAPQPDPADRRRILEMVRDGKLGPEEADRLLTALGASHPDGGGSAVCPYCAEAMPPEVAVCPSCGTRLPGSGSPRTVATPAGSSTVSGGAKALALYAVIIGAVVVWESVGGSAFRGIRHPAFLVRGLLGGLGIASGIQMWRGHRTGWVLGLVWSASQIVEIILHQLPLNRQVLHVGFTTVTNGNGWGVNSVGIVLVCLFVAVSKSFAPAPGRPT